LLFFKTLGAATLEDYNDEDNYNFEEEEQDAFNSETFASTLGTG
jgi:hypothetical protein